jgi:hypothetical protein
MKTGMQRRTQSRPPQVFKQRSAALQAYLS